MEFTREIYWNVGHGFTTLAPMYGLLLVALVFLVMGCLKRIKVYRLGQPLDRTDQRAERIKHALATALLQTKVYRVPGAGTMHSLFFWSFFLLFIGTMLIVAQADFTDLFFKVKFLKGTFYKFFSLILDLAGLLAVVMLQVRRFSGLLLVMATAPLGLIGAVAGLLATGKPFGFVALLGLIGLAGILIRNTLILVQQ